MPRAACLATEQKKEKMINHSLIAQTNKQTNKHEHVYKLESKQKCINEFINE
jgi:hypothetical protein